MEHSGVDWDLLSSYGGLLVLAALSVYAGSYGSLSVSKHDGAPDVDHELEDDEDDDVGERMTVADAYLFPVVGSVALLSLYLVVKYLGSEWINWFLGWYFSLAGIGSVWKSSVSFLRFILGDTTWKKFDKVTVIANKGAHPLFSLSLRTPSLFLFPLAIIPSIAYHFWSAGRRSVLITDILGLSFSHNALSLLKLDSFKTGSILLSGLFLYDIWWVFGTEVMVKVATTLDLPIKLLWPKSLLLSGSRGFTMIGLGDIVIPGTFVALALRYDLARFVKDLDAATAELSEDQKVGVHSIPPNTAFKQARKPYFVATLTAYVTGLVTTMVVMHVFGKAQPALLYLSPACILSFLLTAAIRGELGEAWSWSDSPPEDDETPSKEGKPQEEHKGEKVTVKEGGGGSEVRRDGVGDAPGEPPKTKAIHKLNGSAGVNRGAANDAPVRKSMGRR